MNDRHLSEKAPPHLRLMTRGKETLRSMGVRFAQATYAETRSE